ncbi:MAG: hypothetical protein WDO19_09725 [Bacteroidota bacterium]
MKKYVYISVALFILSCRNGASEAEEAHIKSRILLHNKSLLNYILDSLNKRTDIKANALWHGQPEARAEIFTDSVMKILYKNKNIPYSLNADTHLTYEKFMAFCLQNKTDPVKTANTLK